MKALTLAVVLLTSAAALAQQAAPAAKGVAPIQPAPKSAAPAQQDAAAMKGVAPDQAKGLSAQDAEMMRRPPPPGRPSPIPRNLVMVDRDSMARRMDRLEELLDDAMDRTRDAQSRNKLRKALDELEELKEELAEAAPYGTGIPAPTPYPPTPPRVQPIAEGQFRNLTSAMSRESFAQDKMRVLTSVSAREHFLVNHVVQILGQFPFSQDKLEVVRVMKPTILDMQNSFQLYNAFSFSSDKKRLQDILEN